MLKFLARLIAPDRGGDERSAQGRPGSATSEFLRKSAAQAPAAPPQAGDAPKPVFSIDRNSAPPSSPAAFDPYNTGAFDRGASWERVRKRNP